MLDVAEVEKKGKSGNKEWTRAIKDRSWEKVSKFKFHKRPLRSDAKLQSIF
jgi:hypothetical protein